MTTTTAMTYNLFDTIQTTLRIAHRGNNIEIHGVQVYAHGWIVTFTCVPDPDRDLDRFPERRAAYLVPSGSRGDVVCKWNMTNAERVER